MTHERDRDRTNLRLNPETVAAIDAARLRRAGKVSRNTWITEAIQEKLVREEAANDQRIMKRRANG